MEVATLDGIFANSSIPESFWKKCLDRITGAISLAATRIKTYVWNLILRISNQAWNGVKHIWNSPTSTEAIDQQCVEKVGTKVAIAWKAAIDGEYSKLQTILDQSSQMNQELQEQFQQLQGENQQLQDKNQQLQGENHQLINTIKKEKSKSKQLEMKLKQETKRVDKLNNQVNHLNTEVKDLKTMVTDANTKWESSIKVNQDLTKQLSNVMQQMTAFLSNQRNTQQPVETPTDNNGHPLKTSKKMEQIKQ